jgi:trans-aconitate 2-methyltransferase
VHLPPDEYQKQAQEIGFRVLQLRLEDRAWDFQTRAAFAAFARVTFVEWIQHLPATAWDAFITEILDRYREVAADSAQEANTFKFYQMEIVLEPA